MDSGMMVAFFFAGVRMVSWFVLPVLLVVALVVGAFSILLSSLGVSDSTPLQLARLALGWVLMLILAGGWSSRLLEFMAAGFSRALGG